MQQIKMERVINEKMIDQIKAAVSGKRLFMGGCRNRLYEEFFGVLTVSEQLTEAGRDDLVILFCGMDEIGSEAFGRMEDVLEQMEILSDQRPESVVLVSDVRVYGKSFGETKWRREEDMGYVCHTDRNDMGLQCMRTLEHLACRMAREGRLPVKVVRTQGGKGLNEVLPTILETIQVLQAGKNGEIYNLTGNEAEEDPHTPLEPMKIMVDAEKLEELM